MVRIQALDAEPSRIEEIAYKVTVHSTEVAQAGIRIAVRAIGAGATSFASVVKERVGSSLENAAKPPE